MDKRNSITVEDGIASGIIHFEGGSIEFGGLEADEELIADINKINEYRRKKIRLEMSKAYRAKLAAVGQA